MKVLHYVQEDGALGPFGATFLPYVDETHWSPDTTEANYLYPNPVQKRRVLLGPARVCHTWNALASELLYAKPILSSPLALSHFARAIKSESTLASHVKEIILLDMGRREQWLERQQYIFKLVETFTEPIVVRAAEDARDIIMACPQLQSFRLFNLTHEQSSFFQVFPSGHNSSTATNLDPSVLTRMRSLSLSGPETATFLDLPGPVCWTFTDLTELCIRRMAFDGFACAAFPALRRLEIVNCIIAQEYDLVLPQYSPVLSELFLSGNVITGGFGGVGGDIFIARRHDTLQSVVLGTDEWEIVCGTDWRRCPCIRHLQISVPEHSGVTDGVSPVTLPPSLQNLVVTTSGGVRQRIYLCWDLSPAEAPGYLEGLVAACLSSGWRRIHVSGLDLDDVAKVNKMCQDARVHLDIGALGQLHLLLSLVFLTLAHHLSTPSDLHEGPFHFLLSALRVRGGPDYAVIW